MPELTWHLQALESISIHQLIPQQQYCLQDSRTEVCNKQKAGVKSKWSFINTGFTYTHVNNLYKSLFWDCFALWTLGGVVHLLSFWNPHHQPVWFLGVGVGVGVRHRRAWWSKFRFFRGGNNVGFSSFVDSVAEQHCFWEEIRASWLRGWLGRAEKLLILCCDINTSHAGTRCMTKSLRLSVNASSRTSTESWQAVSYRCLPQSLLWSQSWSDVAARVAGCWCWSVLTEEVQSQLAFSQDPGLQHGASYTERSWLQPAGKKKKMLIR